jgi:glycosyltransferase involved in cell wall biosynthesis
MKIRFLIRDAHARGGTVRTTFVTAGSLARRGHDVEIVSVVNRPGPTLLAAPEGVTIRQLGRPVSTHLDAGTHRLPRWQRPLAAAPSVLVPRAEKHHGRTFSLLADLQLVRYLRGLDGGVVVGTRPGLNLLIGRFAPKGVVRVGQEHTHADRHGRMQRSLVRGYPRLDVAATLTERDAAQYRALLGSSVRVEPMPNPRPDTGGRRTSTGNPVVVAAGRLTGQKGFDRLIRAWNRLAAGHPDWELRIFGGTGPAQPRLERMIAERGLGDRVRLMGFTDRLWDEMAGAAFFAMSSRFEGFPMVLLEAMSIGLPVVSFDCPTGPAELVDHGRTGLLVDDGDIPGLAQAMRALMDDPDRRKAMGEAAVEASHRYDADAIAARWERLFEQVAASR